VRTPLLLYALALVVRGLLIWHFPDPAYPDSAYYVDVARALHGGQGFNVDFVWIFPEIGGRIPAIPTLPIPSNAHWMPLASIVQVPFLAVFGDVAWASAAPFALLGALAAPLTWAIARDVGARPFVAVGAGVLVAIPMLSTVYMAQPDNFSLYQPLVIASLWMAARALRGKSAAGRSFLLAGLFAGLATLARTDGLLVLVALGLVFLWDRWRTWRSRQTNSERRPAIPFAAAVGAVAVFLLVVGPWWARQLAVFGSLSPSSTSGKVLFIRDIGEWNSITIPASLDHLLGMGIGPLIGTRIGGAIAAAMIYLTLICGFILGPVMLIGGWARRRSTDFGPFFIYAAILFAFSALISAVHVPGGTFIHSAVALAPYSYILALEGIVVAIGWVAARRPAWDPEAALRVFGGATIAFAVGVAILGSLAVHATWSARRDQGLAVANALDAAGAPMTDRVMSIDASSTRYWSGHGGVVLVNDPLDTIHDVATAYDIRWLVLDRADAVSSVAPILDGGPRPTWLGEPILAEGSPTQLAVYPVLGTP
jgi:Dolichyl-phosphate-mannose-protein mannosyltransferase